MLIEYSIIIPVYNSEVHLRECLDNVVGQSKQAEIILVDDGSTDGSPGICDSYVKKYDNIKVFHTDNRGTGSARNLGLSKAVGEFVVFLDADDYLTENFFDNISSSELCDLTFFETVKLYRNGYSEPMAEGLVPEEIIGCTKEAVMKHIAQCSKFPASSGGKIIKRSFLQMHSIEFPTDLVCEDIDWTLSLITEADSFGYYTGGKYIYRQSQGSRSDRGRKRNVEDYLLTVEKWARISETSKYKEFILSYIAYEYAMIFPYLGALSAKDRKIFMDRMKRYRYLLGHGRTDKIRLIRTLVSAVGLRNAAALLNIYVEQRERAKAGKM